MRGLNFSSRMVRAWMDGRHANCANGYYAYPMPHGMFWDASDVHAGSIHQVRSGTADDPDRWDSHRMPGRANDIRFVEELVAEESSLRHGPSSTMPLISRAGIRLRTFGIDEYVVSAQRLTWWSGDSRLNVKERRNSSYSGTHLRQAGGFFVPMLFMGAPTRCLRREGG
jgi:hypothetical protein